MSRIPGENEDCDIPSIFFPVGPSRLAQNLLGREEIL
jgi:hypothetical protein